MGFGIWIYVIFHLFGGSFLCGCTLWVYTFRINLDICDYDWSSGGVNSEQIKTPLFLTGLSVSSAESERFELSQDCYTLTD